MNETIRAIARVWQEGRKREKAGVIIWIC